MYVQLAFAAFAASSDTCITWKEFEELWVWLHPNCETNEAASPAESEGFCLQRRKERKHSRDCDWGSYMGPTREIFEKIAGSYTEELSFERFASYAEENPDFEKRLRKAFFSRIASVLVSH